MLRALAKHIPLLDKLNFIETRSDVEVLESIYTPFSEALLIIKERWGNDSLKAKILRKGNLPEEILSLTAPKLFICRPLIVPNLEISYFLDLASQSSLDHTFLEYRDTLVGRNKDKRALGKVICTKGKDKIHRCIYTKTSIINFNTEEGKKIDNINTLWNEPLVEFKRKLLANAFPGEEKNIINLTQWFNERRYSSKFYYQDYLTLFLRNGIIFENFLLGDPAEREFFFSKVLPSFKKVEDMFGVRPIIVPLLPFELEKSEGWLAYPEQVSQHIIRYASDKLT